MRSQPGLLFVALAAAVLLISAAASAAEKTQADVKRPNILWLIGEDLGVELECYGTREVRTPNFNRLGEQGVRYTRFYTVAPVCSTSRSAFMTGMYSTTIGTHNHRSHRSDGYRLPEGVRVLTDWMRDAGYFTANVKVTPADWGFNGTGKTDWNFTYDGQPFDSNRWADLTAHQPFYAQINFQETHRAFHAPAQVDPADVKIPPYYPDHPVTREDWAEYLDAVMELDRKVGVVLKQLESDGLADNTIVVFFGDNGQTHVRGKQFCYEEGHHVPLFIRWPKNFPAPAQARPGTVDERLLASIDLAPTMLAIAGVEQPPKMEGRNFLGAKAAPPRQYVFGARDRCDETVFRFRTVRDDRYRYIRNFMPDRPFLQKNDYKERSYPVWNLLKELNAEGKLTPVQQVLCQPTMPEEELYDLKTDPHQIKNLAGDPEHHAVLERLRGAIEQWIAETGDTGRTPETAEEYEANTRKPEAPAARQPAEARRAGRNRARPNVDAPRPN